MGIVALLHLLNISLFERIYLVSKFLKTLSIPVSRRRNTNWYLVIIFRVYTCSKASLCTFLLLFNSLLMLFFYIINFMISLIYFIIKLIIYFEKMLYLYSYCFFRILIWYSISESTSGLKIILITTPSTR